MPISAAAAAAVRPGCAARSLRESSRRAAEAPRRDADELCDRLDQPGREHRDRRRAPTPTQQGESAGGGDVVGERAVGESYDALAHDDRRDVRRNAEAAARECRTSRTEMIEQARASQSREEPRCERHERPDEQRHDDRARREDRLRLRQVEVQRLEELSQADGEPEPCEEADDRRSQPDHERLDDDGGEDRAATQPMVRSVANSRVCRATMIESVLKTDKADEEGDSGEMHRKQRMIFVNVAISARVLVSLLAARADGDLGAEADPLGELLGSDTLSAAACTASSWPSFLEQPAP